MSKPAIRLFVEPEKSEKPARGKRAPVRLPSFLHGNEIVQVLESAKFTAPKRKKPPNKAKMLAAKRDELIAMLGFFFGLRCQEICDCRVEHFDMTNRMLTVIGKGDRERHMPIAEFTVAMIVEQIGGRTEGWFLLSASGKQLSRRTAHWRMKRLGKISKLSKRFHPHAMRHTFATRLLETGSDIRDVQELLGHRSITSTAIYTHCNPVKLKAAVDRLDPKSAEK